MCVELQGDRVLLRELADGDLQRVEEIGSDAGFAHWWPGLDATSIAEERADGAVVLAVTLDGEVIGLAQFHEENTPDYRHASIDIGIGTAWQDRGLGTDAVRTLARHLVNDRGHHRLVIDPAAANGRAIRCYAKVGFRPVGTLRSYERDPAGGWRDGLLMDLLADELR